MHVMKPHLSVRIVRMVVRMKKAWMYIFEGITLINLNVVYVTLWQEVKKSHECTWQHMGHMPPGITSYVKYPGAFLNERSVWSFWGYLLLI